MDVAEFAVKRRDGGRRQQERDHHPGQILEVLKVAPDGWQRGGDDGLVERGNEDHKHQAIKDHPHRPLVRRYGYGVNALIGRLGFVHRARMVRRRRAAHAASHLPGDIAGLQAYGTAVD